MATSCLGLPETDEIGAAPLGSNPALWLPRQQFLYFLPLPHGQGSFLPRPIGRLSTDRTSNAMVWCCCSPSIRDNAGGRLDSLYHLDDRAFVAGSSLCFTDRLLRLLDRH